MNVMARAMVLALCAGLLAGSAHAAAAGPRSGFSVPKTWPSDPKEKSADAFKRLASSGKLGIAYIYSATVDPADKDAEKKNDEFLAFVKKVSGDKDVLDLLNTKFVVMALKTADKNLAGRGTTVKTAGIVIFGADGQKAVQLDAPLDGAAAFRNLLLQSEAIAAKAKEARAAEKAKEEEQRKREAEAAKKKSEEGDAGKIPGLNGESKTPPAKKPEAKSGGLQDE